MFEEKIITKIGYVETTLPFAFYNQLLENINSKNAFKEDWNSHLAGQIENEFLLDKSIIPEDIMNVIKVGCDSYIEKFSHTKLRGNYEKKFRYNLHNVWINYQKKGEYNPLHHHSQDLVFVIWIKIPYNLEDEFNHPFCKKSNTKVASIFQFANISNPFSFNVQNSIFVDKSYEGKMIVFHSAMEHLVYPFFTSDEYRISMSGNLSISFDE